MKKLFFLALFTIFSFVFAQAIYGTKDSFFNSSFCKKYQCKLTSSTFGKKTGLNGGVWYIYYKIKDPESIEDIQIFTHRDKNGVMIPSVAIGFQDVYISNITEGRNQILSDFFYTIIGKKINPLAFSQNCTDYITPNVSKENYYTMIQDKFMIKSTKKLISYILYCEKLTGNNPSTNFDDSINFVISDDYHPR
jgi:hypothetical protein